jgi:carbon-monoxide dehydrogenase medium subunit
VIPAEFDYRAPRSLDQAIELLAALPDAKLVSGGMSLIPAMKHRLLAPAVLVDLGRVPDLDAIAARDGGFVIGARATHGQVGAAAALAALPIFAETAREIGDAQVRNRGTLAGSLAHADPAGDWPAVFLALGGRVSARGPGGEREIAAGDLFTGMLATSLASDEVIREVRFPAPGPRCGSAYLKLRQAASGFALVGAAASLRLDAQGRCERVAVALTGINAVPFRAASVEARLEGARADRAALAAACAEIAELDPTSDLHASADYRSHLARVYARRALERALERAAA